jgi:hypothetical protein
MASGTYHDPRIDCSESGITIRGYYPFAKHVAYSSLQGMRRVEIGAFTGKGRIWGTANPKYWANWDSHRPRKHTGFVLDVGRSVHPFITPDDPDAFEAAVRAHAALEAAGEAGHGPVV